MVEVWFDGFCGPINPGGTGAIGVVIRKDGRTIYTMKKQIGTGSHMSNNVAEYEALRNALLYLKENGFARERIVIYGDSMLAIQQMKGSWKIKAGLYKDVALKTKELLKEFSDVTLQWIPESENTLTHNLTEQAANN